jgi:hypothetical protein
VQQGRLAGAGGPEKRNGLARVERGGGLFEHVDAAVTLREAAVQVLKPQSRRSLGIIHRAPYS